LAQQKQQWPGKQVQIGIAAGFRNTRKYPRSQLAGAGYMGYNTRPLRQKR
jgi:hypothetical protein